jgi:hypothetical protein
MAISLRLAQPRCPEAPCRSDETSFPWWLQCGAVLQWQDRLDGARLDYAGRDPGAGNAESDGDSGLAEAIRILTER